MMVPIVFLTAIGIVDRWLRLYDNVLVFHRLPTHLSFCALEVQRNRSSTKSPRGYSIFNGEISMLLERVGISYT